MDTIGKLKYGFHVGPYNWFGYGASLLQSQKFEYMGNTYSYRYSPYCVAWQTERSVEIPIALAILDGYYGCQVLEVGNVLHHYTKSGHTVVDLHEQAHGVINEDIRNYQSDKKYDLVMCISTLEHVGDAKALLEAYNNMYSLLRPGGLLFVTIPVSYNLELDRLVRDGVIKFDLLNYMHRESFYRWQSRPPRFDAGYDRPYPRANGLLLGYRWRK